MRRQQARVEPAGVSPGAMARQDLRPVHPVPLTPLRLARGWARMDEEVGPDSTRITTWRVKTVSGVLMVLGLVAGGLPNSQAEIRYSGGRVQVHKDRTGIPRIADLKNGSSSNVSAPATEPSYSPDNDFYYQRPSSPATRPSTYPIEEAESRSYYPSRAFERLASSRADPSIPVVSAIALPWNQAGFAGYDEIVAFPENVSLLAAEKYALTATALPRRPAEGKSLSAMLMFHLPEHAQLWVEGVRTPLKGQTSYFESPRLDTTKKYSYTVRAAWLEDGHWVSQTQDVPVEAGIIQAVYLRPSPGLLARKKREAQIEAALAKLSPEDQEAARQQRMCAIRADVQLGERGMPIKVVLKKQAIFVCDEECQKQALADPELALAKAQTLRAKKASGPNGK